MARRMRIGLCLVLALFLGAAGYLLMFPNYGMPDRIQRAIVGCRDLSRACESYQLSEANLQREWPRALRDLVRPPFEGASFLKNGERDLIDPWGNRYQLTFDTDANGRESPLIWTANHEGLLVTQHGIGPQARPQKPLTK